MKTIAVTAPSFGCTTEPYRTLFDSAVKKFENMGFSLKLGKTCFLDDGIGISTDPEVCARELQSFYLDREVEGIISAGGGELMCEVVPHVDFFSLRDAEEKPFMGYSDNTNFIHPLVTISGKKAVYGPCFPSFGKEWDECESDALELFLGKKKSFSGYDRFQLPENEDKENPLSKYNLTEKKILKCFPEPDGGKALFEGILVGGCLDVLAGLVGTPLDNMKAFNREHGKVVWVLESCDANIFEYRRQIHHLKMAGWFENASGFLIGRPLSCFGEKIGSLDRHSAVTDILGNLDVPVVMDADIGHMDPAMPLLMGADCHVEVRSGEVFVSY